MRVVCRHGHFAFYPRNASEIARFSQFYDLSLVREEDYYTFESLEGAEEYSLTGKTYLNLPAITTYQGKPWDVMRENGFVYDVALGLLVPKLSIIRLLDLPLVGFYYITPGGAILQPGSRTPLGQQILSYTGEFIDGLSFRIVEFSYE